MPPRENSRHSYVTGWQSLYDSDVMFMGARIPFPFRQRQDNRVHIVKGGDTLWALAGKFFAPLSRACGLWWVIADYQPQPIHDPTIELAAGTAIIIPSLRTVLEEVFDDERIYETEV